MVIDLSERTVMAPPRKTKSTEEPLVHTVEEAARILRIGRQKAYESAQTGELPTIRFGRRILVPRAKLLELVNGGGLASASPESPLRRR